MRVIYQQELVVARKGRRGFFKTRVIDEHTKIVDCRVQKRRTLFEVITLLTGGPNNMPRMPVWLITDGYGFVERQKTLFKYVSSGKWVLDKKQTEEQGFDVFMFEGVIVANDGTRHQVKCDSIGNVQKLYKIQESVVNSNYRNALTDRGTEHRSVKQSTVKVVSLTQRLIEKSQQRKLSYAVSQ
jgi:hypothetical protein